MMSEKRDEVDLRTYAYPETHRFLLDAIAEGAHLVEPDNPRLEWTRNKNILGIYFGSKASAEDIGKMYGISGSRVKQIIASTTRRLIRNSSPELRERRGTILFIKRQF
ncbi:MAG: hypothetical protein NUV69_00735 [Candidatus Curtissbacteria bacterium]|nr:hypothetical protein [Candidatus Curtissbacteria bacterium]